MQGIFKLLVPVSLGVVLVVLLVGIFTLFKGGEFGRTYSNKLMRLRVLTQAIAIAVLCAAIYFARRH